MSQFVALTPEDCKYLLDLIQEMDSDTPYTAKQRGYTIPKLRKIAANPDTARLAHQDIRYLLELIEDDEAPEFEQQRAMTQATLLEIQALVQANFELMRDIDEQREARRARRTPGSSLQQHFERNK